MKKVLSILLAVAMLLSLCACSRNKRSAMTIRPSEFSKETQEVLGLFDSEIQFFDISLDETVKSYTISVWVYRDGMWNEDGKTYGKSDLLGNRIAIWLTETSCDIYNILKMAVPGAAIPFWIPHLTRQWELLPQG